MKKLLLLIARHVAVIIESPPRERQTLFAAQFEHRLYAEQAHQIIQRGNVVSKKRVAKKAADVEALLFEIIFSDGSRFAARKLGSAGKIGVDLRHQISAGGQSDDGRTRNQQTAQLRLLFH
ncbi:hypothetical protein L0337_01265 [candidate division KSB1 bacterium]|nr:hypothetical protein [candidate division KSB1 bacterium]